MPGVIGGNSGSFVLAATTLLLHGWVNDTKARVAIVPGAPTSAITPALAERIKAAGKPDLKIELRAESFRAPLPAIEAAPANDADLRVGQDLLATQPIEIDFPHHGVQPLSPGEARHDEQAYRPIAVQRGPGGLSVVVAVDGAPPFRAALDLSSQAGLAAPGLAGQGKVTIGSVAVPGVELAAGAQAVVGLYAFRHMRVIFDLAHDRIWVRA